jgi:tetratricopeptide (TPR) repeat protein
MKKIILFIIFTFVCFSIFAQQERPYWYTLEQGKAFFRSGAYGKALMAFEDAKRNRKAMYDKMERDIINVLSAGDVRLMRDSLDAVEKYIADNYLENADFALKELYYRVPRISLNGSANNALKAIGSLKSYPEAEYWIGETYRVEGEQNLALKQYQKAHEQRVNLENPSFDVEILYKLVDILKIKQDYVEMENKALEIVAMDALWAGNAGLFARTSMIRILETNGISRFLTLYRYDDTQVERIHRLLGFFYYASGRHSNAVDHLVFSFLIQNTIIINSLMRNHYDFEFTTIDALLNEANKNPVLAAYIEDTEYYKTVYYLGAAFFATGKASTARLFWNVLSNQNAGEWTGRANNQIKSPTIERAQETP